MSEEKIVFLGTIVSARSLSSVSISPEFLAVENGKITNRGTPDRYLELQNAGEFSDFTVICLGETQFLMPGFVDCHTHAPQFPNIGLGLDKPLLEWLDKYTLPLESKYSDKDFAAAVYDRVVRRLLKNGTTTACYYGSLHLEGTLELVKSVVKYNQRALVGKVSMNIKNEAGYYNDTEKELSEVEAFIKTVLLETKNDLVLPVVTPRFAVSCDEELMTGLSKIADLYECRIQSHISENRQEIEHVLETNPGSNSYAEVYDKSHLLNNRCIMAHAVFLTDAEIALLAAKGVSVAHCPASNTRLRSGLCPVRKLLDNNITVGLGTDVSGGDSATILDAMRRTMDVSTHLALQGDSAASVPIEWTEAFYLATLGGAKALNLDDKIGSFEVGKEFDALVVDTYTKDGPVDRWQHEALSENDKNDYASSLLQKFVYLGDDRNILQVYVKGSKVKDILYDHKKCVITAV